MDIKKIPYAGTLYHALRNYRTVRCGGDNAIVATNEAMRLLFLRDAPITLGLIVGLAALLN